MPDVFKTVTISDWDSEFDISMYLIMKNVDTILENKVRPKFENPAEIDYSLEKLFFLQDTYKEVTVKGRLFSEKFVKFMMNQGFNARRISPRKVRAMKLPKIKVDRNPREKTKPRVPQFSRLLKKEKNTSPRNVSSELLVEEESKNRETRY